MGERRRQHEVPTLKVSEVVTRNVCIANADETIQDAARIMAEIDAGVVPVGKDGKLVGIDSLGEVAVKNRRRRCRRGARRYLASRRRAQSVDHAAASRHC